MLAIADFLHEIVDISTQINEKCRFLTTVNLMYQNISQKD